MLDNAKLQEIMRFIQTRRQQWVVQIEDEVLKVVTKSSSVEWKIFDELVGKFSIRIRDCIAVNNTIFVSMIVEEGK